MVGSHAVPGAMVSHMCYLDKDVTSVSPIFIFKFCKDIYVFPYTAKKTRCQKPFTALTAGIWDVPSFRMVAGLGHPTFVQYLFYPKITRSRDSMSKSIDHHLEIGFLVSESQGVILLSRDKKKYFINLKVILLLFTPYECTAFHF